MKNVVMLFFYLVVTWHYRNWTWHYDFAKSNAFFFSLVVTWHYDFGQLSKSPSWVD
jgi:hypothetical protein